MHGCRLRRELGVWCAVLVLGVTGVQAEAPPTWIDDAELHDVQWVGSKHAIAVGEHGAIWNSSDGGRQWSQSPCGFDASLRCACFLTDQLGWVSGVDAVPHSPDEGGILLQTKDGGRTWQRLADRSLPPLNYVKFFNLEEGVIVGQPTSVAPSGILKTSDGGQSWHGVQGAAPRGWHAASFPELELGAVAGVQGRVSLMGGEQLFASKLAPQGFRSIRAIQLTANDSGWLAGDGGLVLKTTTKGVVWEPPSGSLPEELREGMDFLALETRGDKVWLAGSPGSVVWHSPDGGEHWTRQLTGQSTPLQGLRFSNDQLGIAVGALGLILRTEDGGRTWQAVRGGGRRVALLSFLARPGRTCPPLLAKLSGEQGYRSAVWIAQRNDLGPLATTEQDTNLQAAVQKCGGHSAEVHWQLPLTVPGLEFSSDKLVAAWQRQTEGRLPQTLLGGLVRQIRMWQPNIVVMDQPSSDDAVCQLLFDAVLHAVPQAADATRYVAQAELTGLASWKVDRIYVRLAAGATGDAHIELDEFLPYMKTSTRIAAGPSIALLQPGRVPLSESIESARIAYRWIGTDGQPATDTTTSRGTGGITAARSRDFFGSLSIVPGTAARRPMGPLDEANLERSQRLVQKQRNFTAIIQKSLDDPRLAGQMIGQLEAIIDGMEPGQAAVILRDLADEYRKRSQFEFVESTYVELVHRYPQEPVSRDAMRWLIQFWCSGETTWQVTRAMTSNTTVADARQNRNSAVQQALAQTTQETGLIPAVGSSDDGTLADSGPPLRSSVAGIPTRLNAQLDLEATHSPDKKTAQSGRLKITRDTDWRTGAISHRHARAFDMAKQLESVSPSLFRSTEIQFPLAALRRTSGSVRGADAIMRDFVTKGIDDETRQLAQRELWTSFMTAEAPQAMAICQQVNRHPHLDGLLSDSCWEDAKEIQLADHVLNPESRARNSEDSKNSLAMFAYDSEFLYFAISVPRPNDRTAAASPATGRQHDADLSRFDRISLRLDIDRDYATWYEFQIDERGCTAESCWEDRRWNPQWFVAAASDETHWRVEAAIPWSDLTPSPPQRGTIYGLSLLRTIPTVGLQSWIQPPSTVVKPSSFGFLRFE